MQVMETLSDGLKREFQVVLPATELEERLTTELTSLNSRVRINGFRPGKVPVAHLRRLYGKAIVADVLRTAMTEAERRIVDENGLKLANQPDYSELPQSETELAEVANAKADLAFKVALEVLPQFDLADLSDVTVQKQTAEVSEAEVGEAIQRMAAQNRPFVNKAESGAAEAGDRVKVDFTGRVDGEPFEGGSGQDIEVVIGSGSFIPGFEEQLVGAKSGETRTVSVTFPENYGAEHLAGKSAEFEVSVKEVQAPGELTIDDELAKGFGMESLDKLKEAVRGAIERDFSAHSRRKLKKEVLDALDAKYAFELPPSLVEQEFAAVWSQVAADLKNRGKTFEDENTTEEAARGEYRAISERRVRLGLVLAQIGERSDIKVTDDEVTQALVERVRQYPGQEKQVWDHYRQNPQALAEVRAPLFEEKVVDHILSQVTVVEEPVSKDALFADDDEDGSSSGEASSGAVSEGA